MKSPLRIEEIQRTYGMDQQTIPETEIMDRATQSPEVQGWVRDMGYHPGEDVTRLAGYLTLEQMEQTFSPQEMLRLRVDQNVSTDWDRKWEEKYPLEAKIMSSLWVYGYKRDYRTTIRYHELLKNLKLDQPGFEVRLTWSSYFNEFGPSVHLRGPGPRETVYLDGPVGILVYYQGKHVLTIGIALSRHGVLISQVQLREKKGNRWLYQLDMPYMDWALALVANTFKGIKLWLVEGSTAVVAVRKSYEKEPCSMTPEDETRIQEFYNRPLRAFTRRSDSVSYYHRKFIRLRRNGA